MRAYSQDLRERVLRAEPSNGCAFAINGLWIDALESKPRLQQGAAEQSVLGLQNASHLIEGSNRTQEANPLHRSQPCHGADQPGR
jgi:hypothetical protein